MLFPAAVLIVVFLASLSVDSALVFLGQRELANAAAAAANDAAAALAVDGYFEAGTYRLDDEGIARFGKVAIDFRRHDRVSDVVVQFERVDQTHVRVSLSGSVHLIFRKAIPGTADTVSIRASAIAVATQR